MLPEPTISDFLATSRYGTVVVDEVADYNRGSDYEALAGPNAILWSRQVQRDTDLFKTTRFNDAEGDDLTQLIEWRYGIKRVLDSRGIGTAQLARPSASAGAGMIWRGTRFALASPSAESLFVRVTKDTEVNATATSVSVPIESVALGNSVIEAPVGAAKIVDMLWDASWAVTTLYCEPGSTLEPATAYRARTRAVRRAARPGFEQAIIDACAAASADNVQLFPSTYGGLAGVYGLNYVYVGDSGYSATPDLVRACTLALRGVRVAGDCLQVLPLQRTQLTIIADVYLIDAPAVMPVARLEPIHRQAILQYMGASGSLTYTVSGIESAIAKTGVEVQDVVLATPTTDATILVNGMFPPVLSRYFVSDADITIRYRAPE